MVIMYDIKFDLVSNDAALFLFSIIHQENIYFQENVIMRKIIDA